MSVIVTLRVTTGRWAAYFRLTYLTVRYGFIVFWGALVGITTQFFINMEIARYTLPTGEGITTGFARLSRHFAWIFIICIIGADMWPGWATGAGVALSYLIGGSSVTQSSAQCS
jgi:hypothetical protein